MKSLSLTVFALLLGLPHALARKPAVEDFVGIEPEQVDTTPPATQALYNFEKEISAYQAKPQAVIVHKTMPRVMPKASSAPAESFDGLLWAGAFFVLCLPGMTWLMMARRLRARAVSAEIVTLPVRPQAKPDPGENKKAS